MSSSLRTAPATPEPDAEWARDAPDVVATLGVRYAGLRGGRRFAPSVAVDPGSAGAQLDAATLLDVPVFPQLPGRLDALLGDQRIRRRQDERAFFLNVWAPDGAAPGSLPVVVFVHGGAWTTGGGSLPGYDGTRIASSGVVVVTLNYRIGPLGHLNRDDEGRPFLAPLDDLRLGLRWVREHIGPRGGDPDRITLAGQSAGAWYAHLLATSPADAGSFARVALLSMGAREPWDERRFDEVERRVALAIPGGAVPHHAGAGPTTGFLAAMDVPALLDAGVEAFARDPKPFGDAPGGWGPVRDARVPADLLDPVASAGRFHPDALLVRTTAHETASFFGPAAPERTASPADVERLLAGVPADAQAPADSPWADDPSADPFDRVVAAGTWRRFAGYPARFADAVAATGRPVSSALFTQGADALDGRAGHCGDLPYQFGIRSGWRGAGFLDGIADDDYERVSAATITELVDFARG